MADLDLISEAKIEVTTSGIDAANAGVKSLGAGVDGLVVAQDKLTAAQIRVNAQLEATAKKYDAEYRAISELTKVQGLLDRARSQGLASTEAYGRIQDTLSAKLQAVAAAAKAAADAQAQLANSSRTQNVINANTGAGQSFNTAGRAEDVEAYGKALDELQAKYDPLFAAQRELVLTENEINAAYAKGAITEQARGRALDQASARFNNQRIEIEKTEASTARLTKGVGLNAYQWQNLSFQVNDVVTSLASGISPFQTLAQQGGQVYQILQTGQGGVGGALKSIAERLLAINPLVYVFGTLAAGLALAAVAANNFAKAQRDVQLALLGAGQGAGVSADQIQTIAEKASATSTITVASAREIEKAFLESGKVYGEVFGKGITAADDFAKASKQTVGDSAKFIAGALSNLGGGGFEDLAKRAGNFDAAFEKTVKDAINRGDDLKAQELVIQRFGEAFDKASEKATGLQSVLQRADQIFKNAAESFGKAVSQSFNGAPLQQQIQQLEQARKNSVAISQASGQPADTSAIDAKIAAKTKALNEQTVAVQKNAEAVRSNADAHDRSGTKTLVPQVASYESLQKAAASANKELNALEQQQASGAFVPPDRINASREAVAGAAAGLKDYALSQNGATMEADKAKKVLAAGLLTIQAVTPEQKAAAASATKLAEAYGTAESGTRRSREAADAYNKTMAESRQQTINTNRAQDESSITANKVADATTKTGQSLEYLKAQRQAEAEAANGTISQSEVEERRKTILRASIAALNQQKAEEIRASRDTTSVQQGLNDKVAAGTMVSAEAQRRAAALNEQMKLAREVDAASGEEKVALAARLKELTSATEAQLDAEKRAQVLSMSEETGRQIETLQKEGELLGSNNRDRAIALAQLQAEQSLKRQGISVTAPESVEYINKEKLKADLTYAKDQYTRLSQDITSALGGIFDDMTGAGKKNLTTFFDSFSKGFSKIGSRMLQENLLGPLVNGGLDGKGGSSAPSLLDKLGSFFGGSSAEKAVAGGAEKGIFSGITSLFSGSDSKNGAAGSFSKSTLGTMLAPAAIGGSIGYQSQSPLIGAAGGALAGFAVGGPIGAVVGGATGLLGGLFGESQARKEAKKALQEKIQAMKDALTEARPQIEALDLMFMGGALGSVGKNITDAQTQAAKAIKTASDGGDQALADKLMTDFKSYVARQVAIFADGFNGTLAEVKAGFGTNGPFAAAVASVQALGEALKGFVSDAGRLSDPAAAANARAAAVQGALSSLDPTPTLSDTQKELARIQGTAAGLTQVLKDLGLSADQAAAAITAGTNKALDALRDKFNNDLDRKINDASGKGYLNDAADLIKEVNGLNVDASAVGGDLDKVQTYFQAAAQKIVDSSQITGDAFNQLTAMFPELQGKLHAYTADSTKSADEMAQAAAKALSEIQDRKRAYEDRAFAVNFSDSSLATKLTTFDRSAEWEQWQEMAKGGQALDELIATQVLERNKLIADYNAAVRDRKLAFQDRAFAATNDTTTEAGQLAAFERQAAKDRADEVKAGGEAIKDLEAAQGAERAKIVADFAKQAADALQAALDAAKVRAQGFNDRLFAATNDDTTLAGKLAAFDRSAAQQRVTEMTAGGQSIVQLEAALSAERLKVMSDFNKQAMDEANSAVSTAQSDLRSAYEAQASTLQTTIDRLTSFTTGIQKFRDSLKLNEQLTTLSPVDRLAEAKNQFDSVSAKAAAGDEDAQGQLQDVAQSYLDAAKGYYASSEQYAAIFASVQGTLGDVQSKAQTQLQIEQQELNALKSQVMSLISIDDGVKSVADAIAALQTALAQQAATKASGGGGGASGSTSAGGGVSNADYVSSLYQSILGRGATDSYSSTWIDMLNAGASRADVLKGIMGSQEAIGRGYVNGGLVGAYANGGLIGNGIWNQDSVVARYAGGGNIALAGGEYVMPAPRVQDYLPDLQAMRAGTFQASNDDSSKEEIRQLRAEIRRLTATVAAGFVENTAAVERGNSSQEDTKAALKRVAAR